MAEGDGLLNQKSPSEAKLSEVRTRTEKHQNASNRRFSCQYTVNGFRWEPLFWLEVNSGLTVALANRLTALRHVPARGLAG